MSNRTLAAYSRPFTLLLLAAAGAYSLWSVRPPAAVPATAPPTDFSSQRALTHVQAIARQPHPVGSVENDRVREYVVEQLTALCPEVQLQKVQTMSRWSTEPVWLANVVGRLKGGGGGPALMLLCHYDSVPDGPGAADDAAGVAAVLETVRAIRAGPPLQRDLIVLITDGEEAGLLGAHLFVAGHPWLADLAFVMNFEARGYGGPAVLMQTGHENGRIVREFARVAPRPFASSFAEDVFRRMPNDTDFTVFRDAGKTGLNFAFFKGLRYYHTQLDNVANLDERSLQHHGSYALSLTRHFGNMPLDDLRAPDSVFFDLFGRVLVHYPLAWSVPVTALACVCFLSAMAVGFYRGRLSVLGVAAGCIGLLAAAIFATILAGSLWWLISRVWLNDRNASQGDVAWSDGVSAVTALIAVAVFVVLVALTRRQWSVESRVVGALVPWFAVALVAGWLVPRSHYLFAWPLLFSSIGAMVLAGCGFQACSGWRWVAVCALAVPAIVVMVPSIYLILITIGASFNWVGGFFVTVLLGLLTAHVEWVVFGVAVSGVRF